jgi:hypothetical protein
MKLHNVIFDIAARLVHLYSPMHGKVTLHLPVFARIKASLHHVVELKLENIYVVQEFLDVFPDELPGMLLVLIKRRFHAPTCRVNI